MSSKLLVFWIIKNSNTLVLVFPVGRRGHRDYDRIELSCANADRIKVSLGLYDDSILPKLAVTTTSEKDGRRTFTTPSIQMSLV